MSVELSVEQKKALLKASFGGKLTMKERRQLGYIILEDEESKKMAKVS